MADSLKTVKAKIENQVKLLETAENKSKRLFKRKRKYKLEKYLKHVKTCLEILQDLKCEGQEIMVAGDKEHETVNVSKWCELLGERLARFDGFVRKLKEGLSLASDRGSRSQTERRFDTRRKVQEKNERRGKDRRNGDEEKGF